MNHLNEMQKATLVRFEKWVGRLFGHTSLGEARHFSTVGHTDAHGNLIINRGRMILTVPEWPGGEWVVVSLEEEDQSARDHTLEGVLLKALSISLRQNFIEHY